MACQDCGLPISIYADWYDETNEIWLKVNGKYEGRYCVNCFDVRARKLGIILEWRPKIHFYVDRQGQLLQTRVIDLDLNTEYEIDHVAEEAKKH